MTDAITAAIMPLTASSIGRHATTHISLLSMMQVCQGKKTYQLWTDVRIHPACQMRNVHSATHVSMELVQGPTISVTRLPLIKHLTIYCFGRRQSLTTDAQELSATKTCSVPSTIVINWSVKMHPVAICHATFPTSISSTLTQLRQS